MQRPGEFFLSNAGGIQYGIAGYAHAKKESIQHIEILDQEGNIEATFSFQKHQQAQITQVLNFIRRLHPKKVKQLWLNPLSLFPVDVDN